MSRYLELERALGVKSICFPRVVPGDPGADEKNKCCLLKANKHFFSLKIYLLVCKAERNKRDKHQDRELFHPLVYSSNGDNRLKLGARNTPLSHGGWGPKHLGHPLLPPGPRCIMKLPRMLAVHRRRVPAALPLLAWAPAPTWKSR